MRSDCENTITGRRLTMIELKPRCAGCGTGNAIDALFCQECGIGLNIENESVSITDIETPVEYHEMRGSLQWNKRDKDGKKTKKKNSLDYLRETLSPKTPFPVDKRLDFRSMEIPDWEFGKPIITQKVPIITQIEQAQTWPDKMVAKTSGLDRPFPSRHVRKPWGGGKCDCDGIKSICDMSIPNEPFESITIRKKGDCKHQKIYRYQHCECARCIGCDKIFETCSKHTSNIKKQEKAPYSAIIGTDVRKGIKGRKRPKKQDPTEYITIKKDYNSKFKYVLLMGLFVISIYTIM